VRDEGEGAVLYRRGAENSLARPQWYRVVSNLPFAWALAEMRMRRLIRVIRSTQICMCLLASMAIMIQSTALRADDVTVVAPGQWVRISMSRAVTFEADGRPARVAKSGATLEGRLQGLDDKSLTILSSRERVASHPIIVPRVAISALDVRRRASWKGAGFLIGCVVGGAAGLATAASIDLAPVAHSIGYRERCEWCVLTILGFAGGGILGAIVAPGAQWQENVALNRVRLGTGRSVPVRMSLAPVRGGGAALSLSVRF
jgi:hypothetical protein